MIFLEALRVKQWVKNLFIFLPLIFGKHLFAFPYNLKAVAAFFLFSFAASAAYLMNDILDLEEDKAHPTKQKRPIASGRVSIKQVMIAACALSVLSVALSFMLNIHFGWIVTAYIILNLIYSKILKETVIIDIFCMGGFFLMRIIAGIVVAEVEFSYWMVFMTVLLAFFLGFNKRRQELALLGEKAALYRRVLSQYSTYFIDQMIAVVTSSIVVVYMLYTVDAKIVQSFGTTHLTYTIPFVYYGIFRYLYLIHKMSKDGDPTNILFSDRPLQLNILLWLILCIAIVYFRI